MNPTTLTALRRRATTGRWAILSAPTSAKLWMTTMTKNPMIDPPRRNPNLSGLLHRWVTARTRQRPAP